MAELSLLILYEATKHHEGSTTPALDIYRRTGSYSQEYKVTLRFLMP
jgi:hypothetical protein